MENLSSQRVAGIESNEVIGSPLLCATEDVYNRIRPIAARPPHGISLDGGEVAKIRAYVTQAGSNIMTSMLRGIENGSPIKADQIIGEMIRRASALSVTAPILSTLVGSRAPEAVRTSPLAAHIGMRHALRKAKLARMS